MSRIMDGTTAQEIERKIAEDMEKSVQVGFKRLSEDAAIPTKAHPTDSGFDLVASEDVIIVPGETAVVPTGIAVQLPEGYEATVRPRSGVTSKTKLRVALGTVDNQYRGEVGVIVDNIDTYKGMGCGYYRTLSGEIDKRFGGDGIYGSAYVVRKGDRVAQLVITRLPDVEAVEVFVVGETSRGSGGFGSSGVRTQLISESITDNHELLSKLGDD